MIEKTPKAKLKDIYVQLRCLPDDQFRELTGFMGVKEEKASEMAEDVKLLKKKFFVDLY